MMFNHPQHIISALQREFRSQHALVIGDVIVDQYVWSEVQRISPEAPVPIAKVNHVTYAAGGAGNVAVNLAGLGLQVTVIGAVGNDEHAQRVTALLTAESIATHFVSVEKPTTTKIRVVSGHQHLLRLDIECTDALDTSTQSHLQKIIQQQLKKKPSVVIISDYAKGLLNEDICQCIINAARALHIPVFVDPKGGNYNKYKGATALTPNRSELAAACQVAGDDLDQLVSKGKKLRAHLHIDSMFLTLGDQGIVYFDKRTAFNSPAIAQNIFDVSGAGDTVIAVLGACVAAKINTADALTLANIAAGIIIGKVGTAAITQEELLQRLPAQPTSKIFDDVAFKAVLRAWKAQGRKIVFTNGCFDILHAGHVSYLERAKRAGDYLVVGVNSDRSVRKLKGPSRPIHHQRDRANVLAALSCIDAVIIFDEATPLALIKKIKPDVLVKGGDYRHKKIIGSDEVASWGGCVTLIDFLDGHSTTDILQRLATPQDTAS